ncbi:MAG: uracil-DNA glycosylase [Planctomycetia bacterium]|nr:uracil-DNA glycosylase [Planctomycetia bacterium]
MCAAKKCDSSLCGYLSDYLEDAGRSGVTELLRSKPARKRSRAQIEKQLANLARQVAACTKCQELVANRTNTVFGVGNPEADLVFLGEGPGAEEDRQGIPFVGRSGQLLTDIITKGMKLTRDEVYICNIVRCRPPGNRTPLPEEAANCWPFLQATLEAIAPKYICCLGSTAATHLLKTGEAIGKLRGRVLDYNGAQVVCTYHPSYLLRNPPAKKQTWEDIQLLMKIMDTAKNHA